MNSRNQRFIIDLGWQLLLNKLEVNPQDLLRHARLPLDLLGQTSPSLTTEEYFRLWLSLESLLDDPAFPLTLGQAVSAESFSPPLFACLCSPDMNTAMERLARYKPLVGPLRLDLRIGAESTRVGLTGGFAPAPPLSFLATEIVFLVYLIRLATRQWIAPVRVVLPGQLTEPERYREFLGCSVEEGDEASITFSAKDATSPFLTVNDAMFAVFEPELAKRLDQLNGLSPFRERVQACLLELIPSGCCSVTDVADRLAVSARTLQRRLRDEGTNFQQVVNGLRRDLASHYLSHTGYSNAEIAFLLGFDDPNSFIRAFQGWTGRSPGAFRGSPGSLS